MSLRSDECPNCKASLNGALIWDHFYEVTGDEKEADRISSMYGATRTNGRCFRRDIGIYDMDKDITVSFRCPDCLHEWKR